jgi:DNA-binding response OmpR family regulator
LVVARILIVEDNHEVAHAIAALLRGSGHDAHVAMDATGALAEQERFDADAVLVDASLPGALDFVRSIRGDRGAAVRLIACTSFDRGTIDRRHFTNAGFDDVLGMPLFLADVEKALGR